MDRGFHVEPDRTPLLEQLGIIASVERAESRAPLYTVIHTCNTDTLKRAEQDLCKPVRAIGAIAADPTQPRLLPAEPGRPLGCP